MIRPHRGAIISDNVNYSCVSIRAGGWVWDQTYPSCCLSYLAGRSGSRYKIVPPDVLLSGLPRCIDSAEDPGSDRTPSPGAHLCESFPASRLTQAEGNSHGIRLFRLGQGLRDTFRQQESFAARKHEADLLLKYPSASSSSLMSSSPKKSV